MNFAITLTLVFSTTISKCAIRAGEEWHSDIPKSPKTPAISHTDRTTIEHLSDENFSVTKFTPQISDAEFTTLIAQRPLTITYLMELEALNNQRITSAE
jgi:hypothetical protein